jgi:hypothetical protein
MSRRQRALILLGSGLLALGACNDLLGIEPAVIDPRLAGLGNGAQAGTSVGTGGTSAMAGTGLAPSAGTGNAGDGGGAHQHSGGDAGKAPTLGGEGGEVATTGGTGGTGGTGTGGTGTAGTHDHSSGGSSGEGGSAGEPDVGPMDPCDEYCDAMVGSCTGEAEQYRDRDQCLRICHLLPPGEENGPDNNDVACRLKYARKIRYGFGQEVTNYCRQAGPSGDGRCGNVCQGFCSLMAKVCTPEESPYYHFESDGDCISTCNGLPVASVEYSSSDPLVSDGDHALCRLFHVTSAAMADAEEHCEHAMGVTLCQATEP